MKQEIEPKWDEEHPWIPIQMFYYIPDRTEQYYTGQGLEIRRYLFDGSAINQLTPFEKDKFDSFLETFQRKKHKVPAELVENPFWTPSWKFRWLYSEQYDYPKTIKAMVKHSAYLQTSPREFSPQIQYLLQSGIFYVSGRDAYYRPIMVFNVKRMLTLSPEPQIEEILEAQRIFFEKVLNDLLLPGQVETWVALIDMGGQNLFSMLSTLRTSFGFLMNTFRCRMRFCYVVNPSGSVLLLWKLIKAFLHEDTVLKINILNSDKVGPMLEFTNPSQVEEKYGGTLPNLQTFWPIHRVSELSNLDYRVPSISLNMVTRERYRSLFRAGQLHRHHVSKVLIGQSKGQEQGQEQGQGQCLCNPVSPAEGWPVEDQIMGIDQIWIPEVPSWPI